MDNRYGKKKNQSGLNFNVQVDEIRIVYIMLERWQETNIKMEESKPKRKKNIQIEDTYTITWKILWERLKSEASG